MRESLEKSVEIAPKRGHWVGCILLSRIEVQNHIAPFVNEEAGLRNVKFNFTGGVDDGRGWKGDVKNMLLDTRKLRSLGWKANRSSAEAVRRACRQLLGTEQ